MITKTKKNKVDFNAELESIAKEEMEKCKLKCEKKTFRRKIPVSSLVVMTLLLILVFLNVVVVVYAVYKIVHISNIPELAGIHITPTLKKATNTLLNEGGEVVDTMESVAGYESWLIYRNNNLAFMYPPGWELKINGVVNLKKYSKNQLSRLDQLSMTMTIGEFDNHDNLPIVSILEKNHRDLGKNPREAIIAGKNALETNLGVSDNGATIKGIYWTLDKKIIYLETSYYNDNQPNNLEKDCQKLIDSLKFL